MAVIRGILGLFLVFVFLGVSYYASLVLGFLLGIIMLVVLVGGAAFCLIATAIEGVEKKRAERVDTGPATSRGKFVRDYQAKLMKMTDEEIRADSKKFLHQCKVADVNPQPHHDLIFEKFGLAVGRKKR